MPDLTIEHLDQKLKEQTSELKVFVREEVSKEINSLAEMTAKGFDAVENRFNGVEQRIGGVERRMAGLELKVDDLDKKVDKLDFKIEEVRDLVVSLDDGPILDLQKRVQVLEKTVARS